MPKSKTKIEKIYYEFEHKIINATLDKIARDDLPYYPYLLDTLASLGLLREKLNFLDNAAWLDSLLEEVTANTE